MNGLPVFFLHIVMSCHVPFSMLSLQVFVFSRTAYSMIKERLKSKGVGDITAKELEGYFSPWHAKHIGQIKVTSMNNLL